MIVKIGNKVKTIIGKPERYGIIKEIRTSPCIPMFLVTMEDTHEDEEWERDQIALIDWSPEKK